MAEKVSLDSAWLQELLWQERRECGIALTVAIAYSLCVTITAHPQMNSNFVSKSPRAFELSLAPAATPSYSRGYEPSLCLVEHERSLATDGYRPLWRSLFAFRQRAVASMALLAVLIILDGCSLPGRSFHHELPPAPEPLSYTIIGITPALVAQQALAHSAAYRANPNQSLERAIDQYRYRVGAQDVLSVVVWDHPELTLPQGQYRSTQETGYVVRADGTIFYPYVGRVQVAGKTTEEIRVQLARLLEPYLKNPQIDVNVVGFYSKRFQLSGVIAKPGLYPITNVPLTVSQAIAQSGGVLLKQTDGNSEIPHELADLSHVLLVRNGKRQELDLRAYYQRGDQNQDRLLQAGDIIVVPDNTFNQVHLLGELRNPGNYPMSGDELNLAQALGAAGGVDLTTADVSHIFVFRGARGKPEVFWLDSGSPDSLLLASRFPLQPQDVVYVSTSDLSRFNRIVTQILPTVQTLWQTHVLVSP